MEWLNEFRLTKLSLLNSLAKSMLSLLFFGSLPYNVATL